MRLLTKPARSATSRPWQAAEANVGEVACQHRGRRHVGDVGGRRLADRRPLVAAEEEQPVPHDRPAERAAELVADQAIVLALAGRGIDRGKRILRIESLVAHELEGIAVQVVRPGLRHGIDRRARVHAVLRAQPAGRDAEFLQRVGKRHRQVGVVVDVVVHGAVQRVGDAEVQAPGHGDVDAAGHGPVRRGAGLHGRAREHDQVGDLAPLQRQFHDALVFNYVADAGAANVDNRRRGLNRDRLLEVADRQRSVDRRRGADLEDDPRLHVGAESLERPPPAGTDRWAGSAADSPLPRR